MNSGTKFRSAVPGGTSQLCLTCKSGLVLRGSSESEEAIFCDFGNPLFPVPFRVRECTGYANREQAPLYQMEEAAHVIEAQLGRAAGFQGPSNGNEDD